MADINLLPVEEKAQEQIKSLQKKLSLFSVIFLIFTAIFTLATLVFFTRFASAREALVTQVEDSSTVINGYKNVEELIVVVKSKASSANKILSERANHSDVFGKLSGLVPRDVYFTDMKISSDKLVVSGRAKTSVDVAGMVASFLSADASDLIKSVSVDSLSSDEQGNYQFSLSLILNL